MMSNTITDAEINVVPDQDITKSTHIIDCPMDKPSAQEWADQAKAEGLELTALCGHVWIPKSEPTRHPVCVVCLDIAQIRLA